MYFPESHFGFLFGFSMIPIALCGIAIDPIYKNFILQGENYGDANFIQGMYNDQLRTNSYQLLFKLSLDSGS